MRRNHLEASWSDKDPFAMPSQAMSQYNNQDY